MKKARHELTEVVKTASRFDLRVKLAGAAGVLKLS